MTSELDLAPYGLMYGSLRNPARLRFAETYLLSLRAQPAGRAKHATHRMRHGAWAAACARLGPTAERRRSDAPPDRTPLSAGRRRDSRHASGGPCGAPTGQSLSSLRRCTFYRRPFDKTIFCCYRDLQPVINVPVYMCKHTTTHSLSLGGAVQSLAICPLPPHLKHWPAPPLGQLREICPVCPQ